MGVLGFGRRYVRVSSCEEETSVDVLIDGASAAGEVPRMREVDRSGVGQTTRWKL
jgi:hypothetical protein